MLFYIIGMSVSAVSMYYSSRNSFLSAKDDMIEHDLNYCSEMLNYPEIMSWFFDYSKNHTNEIVTADGFNNGIPFFEMDDRARAENTTVTEVISRLSDEEKVKLAASVYSQLKMQFDSQSDIFKYGGLMCFDVRDSDRGFIYYEAAKGRDDSHSILGDRCSIDIESHPAIKKILDGNYNSIPMEVAKAEWESGSNYYIGYKPLVYDGELKAVMAINYNWDDFHSQLINQIWLMAGLMLAGMLLCCLILMLLINRIAIKPLSNVQKTVRQYMNDKDSDAAKELLKKK